MVQGMHGTRWRFCPKCDAKTRQSHSFAIADAVTPVWICACCAEELPRQPKKYTDKQKRALARFEKMLAQWREIEALRREIDK